MRKKVNIFLIIMAMFVTNILPINNIIVAEDTADGFDTPEITEEQFSNDITIPNETTNEETTDEVEILEKTREFEFSDGTSYKVTVKGIDKNTDIELKDYIVDPDEDYEERDDEIVISGDTLSEWKKLLNEVNKEDDKEVSSFRMFEIKFISDGGEIELDNDAEVTIEIDGIKTEDTENLQLVFVKENDLDKVNADEDVEIVEIDNKIEDDNTKFSFETKDSGLFFLCEIKDIEETEEADTIKEQTLTASDGKTYRIEVSYDESALIPEGAELAIRELEGEEYEEYLSQVNETLKDENVSDMRAFDISFVKDGETFEPAQGSNVKVSIKLIDEHLDDDNDIKVVHFQEDDEVDVIDTDKVNDGNDGTTIEFTTDSFSVFGVVFTVTIQEDETETYNYYVNREDSILLSTLLTNLEVSFGITDIKDVSSDSESLTVVETLDDWMITALELFNGEATITLNLNEDRTIVITVMCTIPITITAGSDTKQYYDGESLVKNEGSITSGSLREGDTFSATYTGSQTQIGSSSNVPSDAVILDASGRNVTDFYDITYEKGVLTVESWNNTYKDVINKELLSFKGNLATYRITINSNGTNLNQDESLILKDTFSDNQSIIYSSISINGDDSLTNYDYSGYTGTFVVPDGKTVTITYTTRVLGNVDQEIIFNNDAVLGRTDNDSFISGADASLSLTRKLTPSGSDIEGEDGIYSIDVFVYANGHMEKGLEGASFRLLDSNKQIVTYKTGNNAGDPVIFTTNENGYVTVVLNEQEHGVSIHKNTAYYLEMVTAPFEIYDEDSYIYYQKNNSFYSFMITDSVNYSYGGIYKYFNGDVLKVRCYPVSKGVNVTVRFSGNYDLTDEQMKQITFTLQQENLASETGWDDVESHTYEDFSYGTLNFDTGVSGDTELKDNFTYRVIETGYLPESLINVIDPIVDVKVSYQNNGLPIEENSNEFYINPDDKLAYSYDLTFTNTYIDHKLTIIKLNERTGRLLNGATFKVFTVDDRVVKTYTTGDDGSFTIRYSDEGAEYDYNTLYYAVETAEPQGHIMPENPEKVYFYFSNNSETVPEGLPRGASATDLTKSYNTVTIANSSGTTYVPVIALWGLNNTSEWPDNIGSIVVGLYKSVNGSTPEQVMNGDTPKTLTLNQNKNYDLISFVDLPVLENGNRVVYSVVAEKIYDNNNNDITGEFASSSSISGSGWYLLHNHDAVTVNVRKEWYDIDGQIIDDSASKPSITFGLYRSTTNEGKTEYTHDELVDFLRNATLIKEDLTLSSGINWNLDIESLEKTDNQGNLYYYYVLENVPDNQEDSYVVNQATHQITIKNKQTPSTIIIKANNLSKIYGDADPVFYIEASVKEEGASTPTINVLENGNCTASFTNGLGNTITFGFNVNRTEGQNVGSYAINLTPGTPPTGYRVLYENATLTITPAEVTITAGASKIYGDIDPELVTISGLKFDDQHDVLDYTVTRESGEDVGVYPITLSGSEQQSNYIVTYVSGVSNDFIINRANVTVKANNQTKEYGDADPELTADVEGLKNGDLSTVIVYEITRETGEDVRNTPYSIMPSGATEQGNYTVTYVSGGMTITRAHVIVQLDNNQLDNKEKVYGEDDPEWSASIEGLKGNDGNGRLVIEYDGSDNCVYKYFIDEDDNEKVLLEFYINRETGENVGNYEISPSGTDTQGNYVITYVKGQFSITRANLTVNPNKIMKAVGADDPLLTAEIIGWKNGDDISEDNATSSITDGVVTWTYKRDDVTLLTFNMSRVSGEEIGDYNISVTGDMEQSNYNVTYEPGTFVINSILDIDVRQTLIDNADKNANPSYTYKATLDLTGTDMTEYKENGFEMVDGIPTITFELPYETASMRTLKIPARVKITIEQQTSESNDSDYITSISVDGTDYSGENNRICTISDISAYHQVTYLHSRIDFPVEARVADGQEEAGAQVLPGIKGAMGIPKSSDGSDRIDVDFADEIYAKCGYVLPEDKYYVFDHASLYAIGGGAIAGASNIKIVKYNRETSKWQYSVNETDFADTPDNTQLVLFYMPIYVCRINTVTFYTLNAAIDYADEYGRTATIEMLIPDYSIRSKDSVVTIPEGFDITITTANETASVSNISRSMNYVDGPLFTNNGKLTFTNIELNGKNVASKSAIINNDNEATLIIDAGGVIKNAERDDNVTTNGGAIYNAGGTVELRDESIIKDNNSYNGGAIYLLSGTLNVGLGSILENNSASYGGAIYIASGVLNINNGSVLKNNHASEGGAIYVKNDDAQILINGGSSIANNNATVGGAVYVENGTVDIAGSIENNSASINGGAIYQNNGTVNINNTALLKSNTAINGGAVYANNGTVNVTGNIEDNTATNGGAIYAMTAECNININGGSISSNNATNGGAIYTSYATVNVTNGTISENTASNGGAIYSSSGPLYLTNGSIVQNTATLGGAIYKDSGTLTYSANNMSGNTAQNGSAIYLNRGVANISGSITGNISTQGGAIGFGTTEPRIYFSGNANIIENTMNGGQSNIYLDQDSYQILNVVDNNLNAGSRIGIYVPGDINSTQVVKHGDVGGYFASFTQRNNIEAVFVSDRFNDLETKYESNLMYWGSKLTYDVVYKTSFGVTEPPVSDAFYNLNGNNYRDIVLNKTCYPHGGENNTYDIFELVDSLKLYSTYTAEFNNRTGSEANGASAVYAFTFANSRQNRFDNGLSYKDRLKEIVWDNVNRKWRFVKQDDTDANVDGDNRRIVIIYSAPSYITITNNNRFGYTLTINTFTINDRNVAEDHYGYATAKNGATVESLKPLDNNDLVLRAGESVKLLFPGVQGNNYRIIGSFDGTQTVGYTIKSDGNTVNCNATNGNVDTGNNRSLPNNFNPVEIVFGNPLPICKIGNETFSRLQDAVAYMQRTAGTTFKLEMLVDYLIPSDDILNIPNGYNVTFTTASRADGYSGRYDRATLSRDVGNTGASITATGTANSNTILHIENLIFDGRSIAASGNGGAVSLHRCNTYIDNCEFKGYTALRGGAIFTTWGCGNPNLNNGRLEITNTNFISCKTLASADKAGGGAVQTTAKNLIIKNSTFEDCSTDAIDGHAQGGAIFHNITEKDLQNALGNDNNYMNMNYSDNTITEIDGCIFRNCNSKSWAGGSIETDAKDTIIRNCEFYDSYSMGDSGGAVIIYARDESDATTAKTSSLRLENTLFENCRNDTSDGNATGGGAVRTTTVYSVINNCTFINCSANRFGGAISATNDNAQSLEVYGSTFTNCSAGTSSQGGGIYYEGINLTVDSYSSGDEVIKSTFTNCNAQDKGGGIYTKKGNGTVIVNNSIFDTCNTSTSNGGAVCTEDVDLFSSTNSTFINCEAQSNTSNGGAVYTTAKIVQIDNMTASENKASNEGGSIWTNPNADSYINNSNFTNNSASRGGSIYIGGNSGKITLAKDNVSESTATVGGAIYQDNGTMNIYGSSINGDASVNGGGLYIQNGTVNHYGGVVSGSSAGNGGGVYLQNGTYNMADGNYNGEDYANARIGSLSLDNEYDSTAVNGGGIYMNSGTLNINSSGDSIFGNASENGGAIYNNGTVNQRSGTVYGSAKNGGGVYQNYRYNLSNGNVGGIASQNGGAIYQIGDKFTLNNGVIGMIDENHKSSAVNGGGIYIASNTFEMNGGSVAGATASNNGGGVFLAAGTFTLKSGSIIQNIANYYGGGLYYAGGSFNTNNADATNRPVIGGSLENRNIADKGAGVYVDNSLKPVFNNMLITYNHAITEGGGISAGGNNAELTFAGNVIVHFNDMANGIECNVYLDQDRNTLIKNNNLSATSYIGVYASDDQDEEHGLAGKPFATFNNNNNLSSYNNDRRIYLTGVQGNDNLVVWVKYVCKITDGEGNLLYKDTYGTPAVYIEVENIGGNGAFSVLNVNGQPSLYTADKQPYISNDYQVHMLVDRYELGNGRQMKMDTNSLRNVTLTTASVVPDECGFKYEGDPRFPATIIRTANTWSMVYVGGNGKWTLTLKNITLDGGNKACGESGGIMRMLNNGVAILEAGATLQNGNSGTNVGAGVYIDNNNNEFTMKNGSLIKNCITTNNGGGVFVNYGKFFMEGGAIIDCSANRGAGVYIKNTGSMTMSGGEIINNNANISGGGIYLESNTTRVFFKGICNVTDNTINNNTRCNVELAVDSNDVINADGLDSKSEIGVYTPNGNIYNNHGVASKPFGKWNIENDKFFCFVNDRNTALRGVGTTGNLIIWEIRPLLQVSKEVVSDLSSDYNDQFTIIVELTNLSDDMKRTYFYGTENYFGDMNFDGSGKARLVLKDGESATASFPYQFYPTAESPDPIQYRITETLTNNQQADYTVSAKKDGNNSNVVVTGYLGENIRPESESSTSLSSIKYINTRVTGNLAVNKKVISEDSQDESERFNFRLTLQDSSINKSYVYNLGNESGELNFVNGVSNFDLGHNETLTIIGLPTDLNYRIEEMLTESQASKIRTEVKTDESEYVYSLIQEGTIKSSESTPTVYYQNSFLRIVCKITNRNRELLYYRDSNGNLQEAIYSHLEDAFNRVNIGNLRTANNGTVSGLLRIEMVVPEYSMENTAELNNGRSVLLSTALTSDEKYPYNDGISSGNNISVVYRGFDGTMIDDKGSLTLDRITLDGSSSDFVPIVDGGIVKVSNVSLAVNSDATLRNSSVKGNGGAIYLSSGASLNMNGTINNCMATLDGGGIYAADGFNAISTTGTINLCESNGNGGAIYAGTGRNVSINSGSLLINNKATNGGAVYSNSDVTVRGTVGTLESGNIAVDGAGIYMNNGGFIMYSGSEISGNNATNDGAGLWTKGTAQIAGGVLQGNIATNNGGAVYTSGDVSTVTISGTSSIKGNRAKQGAAAYVSKNLTMSSGTITDNTASQKGGVFYIDENGYFTMTGGSISANKSPEGAISTGNNSILAFSGNSVVRDNTNLESELMNVYLGYDSNDIITTNGLGTNAYIGVYVADGEAEDGCDKPIYYDHGLSARKFGTYTGSNINGARLYNFVNDRDTLLTGINGGLKTGTDYYVSWNGRGLQLLVSAKDETGSSSTPLSGVKFSLFNNNNVNIWSSESDSDGLVNIPWGPEERLNGNVVNFAPGSTYTLQETATGNGAVLPAGKWTVVIGRDNSVTWNKIESSETNVNETPAVELPEKAYLGETFGVYNDKQPTVTFDANAVGAKLADGSDERTDIISFTNTEVNHNYTIEETNPTMESHVFLYWATTPDKDDEGSIVYNQNENIVFYRGTEAAVDTKGYAKESITLYAQWDAVVCKITDRDGVLLYVNGSPAVYRTLEAGFDAYNTVPRFTYSSGNVATARRIEMLVGEYTLNNPLSLDRLKTVLLTTAPSTDTDSYAYTGEPGTVCVITRGADLNSSMIENRGNLTLTNITLDGDGKQTGEDRYITCDGGIVNNVQTSSVLSVSYGATLRNSYVNGNGGAISATANSSVYIYGGSIIDNSCTGNGAGIYLPATSRLYLSGSPDFGGTDRDENNEDAILGRSGNFVRNSSLPANATNGGQEYSRVRQDIYLDGTATTLSTITVNGDINMDPGSIWVYAESENHYLYDMQFAVVANNYNPSADRLEEMLKVFRNSRDDVTTQNPNDEMYLYGVVGTGKNIVWGTDPTGVGKVIIRKINSSYSYLSGARFDVYRGNSANIYEIRYDNGTRERLTNLVSDSTGVAWVGDLPYSIYYLHETAAPAGYTSDRWFWLIVDESGNYISGNAYNTREEAAVDANARNAELKASRS